MPEFVEINIKLYMIRNLDGKWFKSRGSQGENFVWVNNPAKAKVYTKPGPARSIITIFSEINTDTGLPDLIELNVVNGSVVEGETKRVIKSMQKKAESVKRRKIKFHKACLDKHQDSINKLTGAML